MASTRTLSTWLEFYADLMKSNPGLARWAEASYEDLTKVTKGHLDKPDKFIMTMATCSPFVERLSSMELKAMSLSFTMELSTPVDLEWILSSSLSLETGSLPHSRPSTSQRQFSPSDPGTLGHVLVPLTLQASKASCKPSQPMTFTD
jgi:hypothetical protein